MAGEGKSLMEQLRGESLKFHKPGEKELPELPFALFPSYAMSSNLTD